MLASCPAYFTVIVVVATFMRTFRRREKKILSLPGIEPRIVRSVA